MLRIKIQNVSKVGTENNPPDYVMLVEDRFVTENAPVQSQGLVVHTQGWTVRLSGDLHGFYNKQIHTVFDSGAAANFRLTEVPTKKGLKQG